MNIFFYHFRFFYPFSNALEDWLNVLLNFDVLFLSAYLGLKLLHYFAALKMKVRKINLLKVGCFIFIKNLRMKALPYQKGNLLKSSLHFLLSILKEFYQFNRGNMI